MFQPVLVSTGVVGWQFLQRTYDRQLSAFSENPQLKRDIDHFREKIGDVVTAEQLVSDRQLLKVALGAFGLEDDLDNRFFIKKMLEEGTLAGDSLANRFADKRYREFSAAFGLGPNEVPGGLMPGFADEIVEKYKASAFEVAAGSQDEIMRVALYAERTLGDVVGGDGTQAQKWFSIMGQPPLRTLFETTFNLPRQFAQVDIDQQLEVFKERAQRAFGSDDPSQFTDPGKLEGLIRTYVARAEIRNSGLGQSGASIALTLLQS